MQAVRALKADPSREVLAPPLSDGGVGATKLPAPPDESAQDVKAKMTKLRALADVDKKLIATLQGKIEEQRRELDNRTSTIATIQRNFENLSTIAQSDRQELTTLRESGAAEAAARLQATAAL